LKVDDASVPFVLSVPVSIGVDYDLSDHVGVGLNASNAVPGVLSDAPAHFRALPARTALTMAATGRW